MLNVIHLGVMRAFLSLLIIYALSAHATTRLYAEDTPASDPEGLHNLPDVFSSSCEFNALRMATAAGANQRLFASTVSRSDLSRFFREGFAALTAVARQNEMSVQDYLLSVSAYIERLFGLLAEFQPAFVSQDPNGFYSVVSEALLHNEQAIAATEAKLASQAKLKPADYEALTILVKSIALLNQFVNRLASLRSPGQQQHRHTTLPLTKQRVTAFVRASSQLEQLIEFIERQMIAMMIEEEAVLADRARRAAEQQPSQGQADFEITSPTDAAAADLTEPDTQEPDLIAVALGNQQLLADHEYAVITRDERTLQVTFSDEIVQSAEDHRTSEKFFRLLRALIIGSIQQNGAQGIRLLTDIGPNIAEVTDTNHGNYVMIGCLKGRVFSIKKLLKRQDRNRSNLISRGFCD